MPNPTRAMIDAVVAVPTYLVEWYQGGIWTNISNAVVNVDGEGNSTINADNPIGFGDASDSTCTIQTDGSLDSLSWQLIPIRISLGFEGNNKPYFNGYIFGRSREYGYTTFEAGGFARLIANSTAYSSLFYNRPAATKTTVASIEDPSNPAYQGGIINYILWNAGGRPYEQDFTYGGDPNKKFYYSTDQSPFRIEFAWVAGENIWEEALKVARASGGQIYQDMNGTIRYKNPLSFATLTTIPPYNYTTSVFESITEENTTAELVGEVRCNYTPRFIGPLQQVYQDSKPFIVEPGKTISVTCETQWPLAQFVFDPDVRQLPGKEEQIIANYFDGGKVNVAVSGGYLTAVSFQSAQKIVLDIGNTSTRPFVVHKVTLYGVPVLSSEQKSISYGTGLPQKILEDNVYIQNEDHALRLALLVKDFYSQTRPMRTLSRAQFDPDRYVGEVVWLTYAPWGISNSPHRIASIQHSDTGIEMDVGLVPLDGLPTIDMFFIVANTYADGDVRLLGY